MEKVCRETVLFLQNKPPSSLDDVLLLVCRRFQVFQGLGRLGLEGFESREKREERGGIGAEIDQEKLICLLSNQVLKQPNYLKLQISP